VQLGLPTMLAPFSFPGEISPKKEN
jgi:hypothetical protein